MGWLPVVTIFKPIFPTLVRTFYSRATYGLGGPVLSTVRGVEIRLAWRVSAAFSTFLQLDSEFMRPRRGPLYQDSSLERLFKGCEDSQIPKGWENHRHTAWSCPFESFITWSAPSNCHEEDIETRSPTLRHLLWTRSSSGDGFTWDIWWWCI